MSDRIIDLPAEMMAAAAESGRHLDKLLAFGIPAVTIAELGAFAPLGIARVTEIGNGLFEPSSEGERRLIIPVYENGGVIDLIATNPSKPNSWTWRIGQGWALNADEFIRPRFDDEPIDILPTPMAWLRDGAKATVILNFDDPELVPSLRTCGSLRTDTMSARLIRLAFSRPRPLPEIIVTRGHRRAA